jgi:N6-L-threonylcarbamoyladenine synthase
MSASGLILALETSCDETAAALFAPDRGLLGEWIHSQIAVHERHGGVVPDLAAREHLRQIGPLIQRARAADPGPLAAVAVTYGPGLAPCLALGVAAAKALALASGVPLLGVSHLRGHVWSPFIGLHREDPAAFAARRRALLPHLALLVSGGHTLLASLDEDLRVRVLSSTRDDAAGEALDKGAKLLGLGYPGGPQIERHAAGGRPQAYAFPRSLGRRDELDFSFSGLKTSLRYRLEKMPEASVRAAVADLCASYQEAVVEALSRKSAAALARGAYRSLGLSGGVGNNGRLRAALTEAAKRAGVPLLAARPEHTGDNAGMIAFAAWADPEATARAGPDLRIEPSLGL